MYYSPVPLLVIRADTPALIEVNGHPAGECGADTHIALPLSDSGDYYITLLPLSDSDNARLYPVTRKIGFESGSIRVRPAPDVSVCEWPGGVFELTMRAGRLRCASACRIPYRIDRIEPRFGSRAFQLTLYYENGIKLSVEEGGRALCGYALGEGESGTLNVVEFGGTAYVAVRTAGRQGERLLLLNAAMEESLDVSAAAVQLEENAIEAIDPLGTLLGHERRIRYQYEKGEGFVSSPAETGFFTRPPRTPRGTLERAIAFAEAVREGFEAEAMSYLADDLATSIGFDALQEFFGTFTAARPPISDGSGRYLGLITEEEGNLSCARLYEFEFNGEGQIENITEA